MKKSLGPKTLAFPTPVWVVGTYDKEGKPNAMTAAWAAICWAACWDMARFTGRGGNSSTFSPCGLTISLTR